MHHPLPRCNIQIQGTSTNLHIDLNPRNSRCTKCTKCTRCTFKCDMYQMRFSAPYVPDALLCAICTRCAISVSCTRCVFLTPEIPDALSAPDVPDVFYNTRYTFQWPDAQLEPDVRHLPDVFADQMSQQTKYPQRARFPHRPSAPTS
ncbi:hypothetical protein F2Q70_00009433 [Brassica cretica]|uniref:4Fe-4S ferredoxin-type domain-containing protein n=1 Tax=Brassica cretica TaxID=69181 RepID=A0A3N6RKE8_BRACR|nr:hypothetical protein F2Q70_00009433 [Brassica cretica]KAF3551201.1 hypothetical protein DY000_02003364 [Brassica cretica]